MKNFHKRNQIYFLKILNLCFLSFLPRIFSKNLFNYGVHKYFLNDQNDVFQNIYDRVILEIIGIIYRDKSTQFGIGDEKYSLGFYFQGKEKFL